MAIPRFIQIGVPLPPLKPMAPPILEELLPFSQLSDKSHQGSLSGFKYFNPLILKNFKIGKRKNSVIALFFVQIPKVEKD
jgi:hypothetical protein